MEIYFFQGLVLPTRAQLTLRRETTQYVHPATEYIFSAEISILNNEVAVWIESDADWEIFTLRNVVISLVQNQLNIIGFVHGYAYNLEITRAINKTRGIDRVFGIDIPTLEDRAKSRDHQNDWKEIQTISMGIEGMLITRCLNDLNSAMKWADDTGFYCYRALESLRHHCAAIYKLSQSERTMQWEKFRDIANCDEQTLREIQTSAEHIRHGENSIITSEQRASLFTKTWDIVSKYIENTNRLNQPNALNSTSSASPISN